MVALETIIVRNDAILDANVGDETVLMSVENGQYYALTATSRAVWERLKQPVRVRDLCADLASAYQTPLETIEADTLEFLSYLEAQKMIEVRAA
ncbi:PqqD family peptide modification chaperone [Elstera sp.]|jgi:hypothetical protein|uniref:PqqD family peptide modification chaperone n=1 Tax=Elstera sp. TaxID=1916664 RepID=UPI0037BFC365